MANGRIKARLLSPKNLARNYGDSKEMIKTYNVINSKLDNIITVRFFMGRWKHSSVVYCSVWLWDRSGTGNSNGYGYRKLSRSLDKALTNSGVKLSREIEGTKSIEGALRAIALAYGFRKVLIVHNP